MRTRVKKLITVGMWATASVVLAAAGGTARAGDLFPYFKPTAPEPVYQWLDPWEPPRMYGPEVAHVVATECGESDRTCIAHHDEGVLTLSIMLGSPGMCERATRPEACTEAYRMTTGDVELPARWAGLDDPCTFVEAMEGGGVAHLYSPRTGERRKAWASKGWKHASFIGACDLATLTNDAVSAKPQLPWQTAPVPGTAATGR